MQVPLSEFRVVPYLAVDDIGDRIVNLMALWDGKEWHHWLPHAGKIIKMQMFGVVVGEYLAKRPEGPADLSISFLEFAWQRASWPELFGLWRQITDDVHNFAASTAKIEHFVSHRQVIGAGVSSFVQTELEYLLALARSTFDLLQEMVARIWARRVRSVDPIVETKRKRRSLPKEFSSMVLKGNRCSSADEIAAGYPISPGLANAYADAGLLFLKLRAVRDKVVHGGKAIELIFMTETGPCIHRSTGIFEELGVRAIPDVENNNLLSLWPVIAHVVFATIATCDHIAMALEHDVLFPPALAPQYSVYLRGFHSESLSRLKKWYE